MKKIIVTSLLLSCVSVYADGEADLEAKRMAWSREYLEKKGLPAPGSGIKIIPVKFMSSFNEKKEERAKIKRDIMKFGYIKEDSPVTNQLMHIKFMAQPSLHAPDGELKKNIDELKIAYTPTKVPESAMKENIGAAPYLTYLKDEGWVGATQFFTNDTAGNCSFSENNIRLSHGSVVLAEEDVTREVNDKATMTQVKGTKESGFTYTVEWFDNTFFRKLECAKKSYSKETLKATIELAKLIDNNG